MNSVDWFVRTSTETLGPYPIEVLRGLVEKRRVMLLDFAWHAGLSKWTRLCECSEFKSMIPLEPSVPLPGRGAANPDRFPGDEAKAKRAPRVPFRGHFVTSAGVQFTIVNISQSGMLMRAEKLPPIGMEIEGRIESESLEASADGVRVRVMRHAVSQLFHGAGVVFLNYPQVAKEELLEYISKHSNNQLAYE